MSNDKQQTGVEWYHQQIVDRQNGNGDSRSLDEILEQAKEMENREMRSDIEEKWKQYRILTRILTNNEDAWLFKEWLIEQTYGGNK
jgi:hypothetical protein